MTGRLHGLTLDLAMRWLDARGFGRERDRVCGPARGTVLEIGAGTGRNLRTLVAADTVIAVEPDATLHRRLSRSARRAGRPVTVLAATGESLPLGDASVDTVVLTFAMCSVDDPDAVVAEIRRVLRPGGTVRFAEHVRDTDPARAAVQDRRADGWAHRTHGCRPNRDTLATLAAGGLRIVEHRRSRLRGAPRLVSPLVVGVAARD